MQAMPNQIKFTTLLVGTAIGSVLTFIFIFSIKYTWSGESIRDNRENLVRMYDKVEPGQPDTTTAKILLTIIQKEKTYSTQNGNSIRWYISAPPEFMQGHWILEICIEHQIVTGVRFGIGDDMSITPKDSPKQKGRCKEI